MIRYIIKTCHVVILLSDVLSLTAYIVNMIIIYT